MYSFRSTWLLIATLLILAGTPAQTQDESASTSTSITIETKGGYHRWRTSNGSNDFNVEARGRIEITEDDKDIKGMSDDGYLEISKTVFGSKRTIIIEAQGGGKVKRE